MDQRTYDLAAQALSGPPVEDITVPFFIMGMMLGVIVTLLVQAYGRRKAKLAVSSTPTSDRAIELLSAENEKQLGQITRLQDRIAVLERIATDKPTRLSAEIDGLR
jgi:hypothetical protein